MKIYFHGNTLIHQLLRCALGALSLIQCIVVHAQLSPGKEAKLLQQLQGAEAEQLAAVSELAKNNSENGLQVILRLNDKNLLESYLIALPRTYGFADKQAELALLTAALAQKGMKTEAYENIVRRFGNQQRSKRLELDGQEERLFNLLPDLPPSVADLLAVFLAKQQYAPAKKQAFAHAAKPLHAQRGQARQALEKGDIAAYRAHMQTYLHDAVQVAAEYVKRPGLNWLDMEIYSGYKRLSGVVRFLAKQPEQALAIYQQAAELPNLLPGGLPQVQKGFLHLWGSADIYQFDLKNKTKAAEYYEKFLQQATQPTALRNNEFDKMDQALRKWVKSWLPHEIAYLRTGKRFSGKVSKEVLSSFKVILLEVGNFPLPDEKLNLQETWVVPIVADPFSPVEHQEVTRRVLNLPPSRFIWLRSYHLLPHMTDSNSVLGYMAHHDPAGYWTAVFFGFALYEQEKLRSGTNPKYLSLVQMMPMPEDKRSLPWLTAAQQYLAAHHITLTGSELLSTPEKTWTLYLDSLKKGDRKTALKCFTSSMQNKVKPLFSRMSSTQLAKMADSFIGFAMTSHSKDIAEATVIRQGEEGKKAGFASFIKQDGEWRIDGM